MMFVTNCGMVLSAENIRSTVKVGGVLFLLIVALSLNALWRQTSVGVSGSCLQACDKGFV
jgi:hypothetical protein